MEQLNEGYRRTFLGSKNPVKLPVLNSSQRKDLVKYGGNKYILDYIHYSVVMSKMRRFAYFSAVNIDGSKWVDNDRSGTWKRDARIKEQFGRELYNADKSDFDKGHLVKREDPEWGDKTTAENAGENTFIYTNCVPQHRKLNQNIWEELENNILHKGAVSNKLKISVFTGPVLSENDGIFVTRVNNEDVKIPFLFWKVITWVKTDGKTYAVGFVQSQEKYLLEDGIITRKDMPTSYNLRAADDDYFEHMRFRDGKTYQVRINDIEKLTGLRFDWPGVIKPFENSTPSLISANKAEIRNKIPHPRKGMMQRSVSLELEGLQLG
jgi:endonuclease G, mitochondrial